MKQKLTVLSLASLLAITPVASSFAETSTGTGTGSSATESETGTGTSNTSETGTGTGTGTGTSNTSETGTGTGTGSSESRLGDGNGDLVSDFSKKSFGSNLDEVTALSQRVKDYLSQIDKNAYEEYLKEQEQENDLFTIGQNVYSQSQIDEVQKALESNPQDHNLYVELALMYLASGNEAKADEVKDQLIANAPESNLALMLQAELASRQGKSDEALLHLEKAVEKNPTSSVAQRIFGEKLAEAGTYNEAIAHLTIAAALNPTDKKVFEELNQVFTEAKTPGIKTFVNGVTPEFDVKPFIENGRTLVPIRAISEPLGANVNWDGVKQQVSMQRGNVTIQLTINSNVAIVNGKEISLDVPARIVDGRTVLPVRFVSEALGANVDWKGESQLIVISEQ